MHCSTLHNLYIQTWIESIFKLFLRHFFILRLFLLIFQSFYILPSELIWARSSDCTSMYMEYIGSCHANKCECNLVVPCMVSSEPLSLHNSHELLYCEMKKKRNIETDRRRNNREQERNGVKYIVMYISFNWNVTQNFRPTSGRQCHQSHQCFNSILNSFMNRI